MTYFAELKIRESHMMMYREGWEGRERYFGRIYKSKDVFVRLIK